MTPSEAQLYCKKTAQQSGSNFFYSFLFLPRPCREAMYTIYAFCREVDSAVDNPPPGSDPHALLQQWREEVHAAYHGTPTHPIAISLASHVHTLEIPEPLLYELIAGVEMDLHIKRYATFQDLYPYCYRVASVVGLICLRIFGVHAAQAIDYAINLGLAFQLTNILRDVGRDAERDRIYLPQEDLHRFGYSEHDLVAHTYSPAFVQLMEFECARARQFYRQAQQALAALSSTDRQALVVAEIMRGVYTRLLDQIQANRYHVFGPRIRVPPLHRLIIAASVWFQAAFHNRIASVR
ncbi:MAG: squalene synthase HpnD [Nitrospirae bacterium]|nr:MAG: squalene synthase HpnD [Nitrospirota bacterium]